VSFILVTNDDGVESPALVPLVRALSELAPVRAVVPDRERSWVGKAITRFEQVRVERTERDGIELFTATGTPADCAQLGIHSLFGARPELVVSGVNVGFNHGLAFLLSSGTVGAAAEGWIAGIPALAFSVGVTEGHRDWATRAWSADSGPLWSRASAIAASVARSVRAHGFPAGVDVLSVNFPDDADEHTPREVTRLARVGYDELFRARDGAVPAAGPRHFSHAFRGPFRELEDLEGTDLDAARRGRVSITPVRLAHTARLDEETRRRLEQP
jgi:5'-nucleotidase